MKRRLAMSNGSTLSLPEIEDRIAILRDNIRQLTEQAAAVSGAADEARASDRIAAQQADLDRLGGGRGEIRARRATAAKPAAPKPKPAAKKKAAKKKTPVRKASKKKASKKKAAKKKSTKKKKKSKKTNAKQKKRRR